MKKYKLLSVFLLLMLLPSTKLLAQTYTIGDVISFPDGSQGVVFFVDPQDARRGTAVAFEDVPGTFTYLPYYTSAVLTWGISRKPGTAYNFNWAAGWSESYPTGSEQSDNRILREKNSQAALAVDYAHGWYLPSSEQYDAIITLSPILELNSPFHWLEAEGYWPCNLAMYHNYYRTSYFEVVGNTGVHSCTTGCSYPRSIRAVHDFGNEAEAEWQERPTYSTMVVKPTETTVYTAEVVYGTDTFLIPQTVVVDTPSIRITTPVDHDFCLGYGLNFSARYDSKSSPRYTFNWSGTGTTELTYNNTSTIVTSKYVSFATPGEYQLYVQAVNERGNCRVYDTVSYRVKPQNTTPLVSHNDTVCYDNDALLTGLSEATTLSQYYQWFDDDLQRVKTDTLAAGVQSELPLPALHHTSNYYVTVNDENTCPFDPTYMRLRLDTVRHSGSTPTSTFLFDAAEDGGTTHVGLTDRIAFFDEGGPDGNYSSTANTWVHTFVADEGQLEIYLDSCGLSGPAYNYLLIYDGPSNMYPQVAAGRTSSTNTTYGIYGRSTTGMLTVVWKNTAEPSTERFGWAGYVRTVTPHYLAEKATGVVKAPLDASAILSTTNDTICYDYTATLEARSALTGPQYYTWWDSTLTVPLFSDTVSSLPNPSVFQPEHQIQDSLYYVTIHNDHSCPYVPAKYPVRQFDGPDVILDASIVDDEIYVDRGEVIHFYDQGGKTSNFPSDGADDFWCRFTAGEGGKLYFHIDTIQCTYFELYEMLESGDEALLFDCYNCALADTTIVAPFGMLEPYCFSNNTTDMGWEATIYTDESLFELAESRVKVKTREISISTADKVFSPCVADTILTAAFADMEGVTSYTTKWIVNGDTVAIHSGLPASCLGDTIPYTAPAGTTCSDISSYHLVLVSNTGCELTSAESHITFAETVPPTFVVPADTAICRSYPSGTFDASPALMGVPTAMADNCTPTASLTYSFVDLDTTGSDPGERVIARQWSVTDLCGNSTQQVQHITIKGLISSSLVTFDCPADKSVTLRYGQCDTLMGIGNPTYSYDPSLGTITFEISHDAPSDSIYTVTSAPRIVTWTLHDNCGFGLTCEQKVTVAYPPCGTPSDSCQDVDGNKYSSVRIGCNCWTGENIRADHYTPSSRALTEIPGRLKYDDSDSLFSIYGYLYTWYSTVRVPEGDDAAGPTPNSFGRIQGVCPDGWAIPTQEEYIEMVYLSGGTPYIKDPSYSYWHPGLEGLGGGSGFKARGSGVFRPLSPGGYYESLMSASYFWTVSSDPGSSMAVMVVCSTCSGDDCQLDTKRTSGSVRCIRIY